MILVNVLLGFSQFFRAIPIMNPLPWFMIQLNLPLAMASINPLANARAWSTTYPLRNPRLAATIIAILFT